MVSNNGLSWAIPIGIPLAPRSLFSLFQIGVTPILWKGKFHIKIGILKKFGRMITVLRNIYVIKHFIEFLLKIMVLFHQVDPISGVWLWPTISSVIIFHPLIYFNIIFNGGLFDCGFLDSNICPTLNGGPWYVTTSLCQYMITHKPNSFMWHTSQRPVMVSIKPAFSL